MPRTTEPSWRLSISAERSAENSCSTTARRETTTLLRFWSSLMTLNSSGLFSRYEVSRTGRTSTSEPGRNARTCSISTVNPPLTRPVMTPMTISALLNASSRRVQVRARLAFSRDRRVSPVPSSTESSATSTSSPGLTSTSPRSFLNWSIPMTASDLRPTLTITTSSVTSTTSPIRIIPGRIRWLARLCSNSSAKDSVIILTRTAMRRVVIPRPHPGARGLPSRLRIHAKPPDDVRSRRVRRFSARERARGRVRSRVRRRLPRRRRWSR